MPAPLPRRILLLRDPRAAASAEWHALGEFLPGAERAGSREAAARLLEDGPADLIVTGSVLPDGGPYSLLSTILSRRYDTTVIVHIRLESGPRWLKLFAEGEFDLQADSMTNERFFRWLEDWLAAPQPHRVGAPAHAA